jgi:hypothetical protein
MPIMRSTVGPLPAAVYWRRRAVVLGAALLGIIFLFVSCSGGNDTKHGQGTAASHYPTPGPASSTPDETPSFTTGRPGGGPSLPQPGDLTGTAGPGTGATGGTGTGTGSGTGTGANTNVTAPSGSTCTDAEISVVPAPAATAARRGTPLVIQLKIKNIGTRMCSRDLGAVAQELYIDLGAQKVWSSDTCSSANYSQVVTLSPGIERLYSITWNGRTTTKCQAGYAAGPAPAAGAYEVRGRLSTKISDPVALAIVA